MKSCSCPTEPAFRVRTPPDLGSWRQRFWARAWRSLTAPSSTSSCPHCRQHFTPALLMCNGWVVESYGIFLSALILAGGALGDLFGRRRIFLIGVGVFAAASIACGLSSSIQQLIAARSEQGVGAALLVPGSLAIISAGFNEESRGKAIGTWSAFSAITAALGPVLGGSLIQYVSWRWAFLMSVPLAVAIIAISLRHVPESRVPRSSGWIGSGPCWPLSGWREW
jgi:MFS family permease